VGEGEDLLVMEGVAAAAAGEDLGAGAETEGAAAAAGEAGVALRANPPPPPRERQRTREAGAEVEVDLLLLPHLHQALRPQTRPVPESIRRGRIRRVIDTETRTRARTRDIPALLLLESLLREEIVGEERVFNFSSFSLISPPHRIPPFSSSPQSFLHHPIYHHFLPQLPNIHSLASLPQLIS